MKTITSSDIKDIFEKHIQKNSELVSKQIQDIVARNYVLSEEDRKPHQSEIARGSDYSSWRRKVQAVLHEMKEAGKVDYIDGKYIFV